MPASPDPIELAVFQNAMHSIAEEMGAALRRTAISPNIKERRDYSCAVFDRQARVIAMGDHMPVHLGSMPMSVQAAIESIHLESGDIAVLNDPYAGGTHLPDITMVMAVYPPGTTEAAFYVAARAHHADVGGMFPGSMGPAREIFQEGIRIPPVRLVRSGQIQADILSMILLNVRTPREREGDLAAQLGACRIGEQRLLRLLDQYSAQRIHCLCDELLDHSERLVRAELSSLPEGEYSAEDFLDDDGCESEPIRIAVRLRIDASAGAISIDFTGSSSQVRGSINAVRSITLSACFYVLRCLLPDTAPATAGILRPLQLTTQSHSVVDAQPPAAVAGGNVETSQRIVDTILLALSKAAPLRIPAASAGTMSNLTIGGLDPRTQLPFTYYETAAGGMGARSTVDGVSGVQTHMTNSLNTPIEALEFAYPIRMLRYAYRPHSGGAGLFRGGEGLVRELQLLSAAEVSLLADRRNQGPYGLHGGHPGTPGSAAATSPAGLPSTLPGKFNRHFPAGTVLRLETPGGGGWGEPNDSKGPGSIAKPDL